MDSSRKETFEDDTITDPAERTRVFGQYDHRRIYGRDYADRLRSADSKSPTSTSQPRSPAAERRLYALPDDHFTSFTKSGSNRLPARFPAGTDRASSRYAAELPHEQCIAIEPRLISDLRTGQIGMFQQPHRVSDAHFARYSNGVLPVLSRK